MAFFWTAKTAPGITISDEQMAALDLGSPFETQVDAEDWLSASFGDLSDAGLESVSLYEDDQLVYGPMRLGAA